MEQYIVGAAFVLLALIVGLLLRKDSGELGLLLSLAACSLLSIQAVEHLKPVIEFVRKLGSITGMDSEILLVLLKSVGIGMIGELAGVICVDAGNTALSKVMQIFTAATILAISLPVFEKLLDIMTGILDRI